MADNTTVLIIEPNEYDLQALRDIFELEEYEVLCALTGTQGIALAQQYRPHLIISTPNLSDIRPDDLVQQLRDNPRTNGIPLLAIIYRRDEFAQAYRSYTNALLNAPFDPKDLVEAAAYTIRKDDSYWTKRAEVAASPPRPPSVNLSGRVILMFSVSGTLTLAQILLERTGCKVFDVTNQAVLENLLDTQTLHLIIIDVNARERETPRLVQQIRQRPSTSKTPILILSARGDGELIIKCLQAGATDYHPKPLVGSDLLSKVHTMLEKPNPD